MALVAAKCTQCGASIDVDDTKEAGICRSCGTAFITQKVISNTYITQHITKNVVYGTSEKNDIEELLKSGETFLSLKDWEKAMDIFSRATQISPDNYKCWIGLIQSETKGFYDLFDTQHIEHYKKALAVASNDEKTIINNLCGKFLAESEKFKQEYQALLKKRNPPINACIVLLLISICTTVTFLCLILIISYWFAIISGAILVLSFIFYKFFRKKGIMASNELVKRAEERLGINDEHLILK